MVEGDDDRVYLLQVCFCESSPEMVGIFYFPSMDLSLTCPRFVCGLGTGIPSLQNKVEAYDS